MKKLLGAQEIADLRLPGFPSTKAAIRVMAQREGWYFEKRTGLGGTRLVYELPLRYQAAIEPDGAAPAHDGFQEPERAWGEKGADQDGNAGTSRAASSVAKVVGTIAAGSGKVDPALLETAMRALSEWETERRRKIADDRRPAVIAILYDYLQNAEGNENDAIAVVLRALG